MNKTLIALAVSFSALTTAHAGNSIQEPTRQDVVAELAAARAADQIPQGEQAYPTFDTQTSAATRTQVVSERNAAQAAGELTRGEQGFAFDSMHAGSHVSRAQVHADLVAAKANGEVTTGEANNVPVFAAHTSPANRGQAVLDLANQNG